MGLGQWEGLRCTWRGLGPPRPLRDILLIPSKLWGSTLDPNEFSVGGHNHVGRGQGHCLAKRFSFSSNLLSIAILRTDLCQTGRVVHIVTQVKSDGMHCMIVLFDYVSSLSQFWFFP